MRLLILLALMLVRAPPCYGQPSDSVVSRSRSFTMTAGFGNAMGWLGLQGEKYLGGERVSVFGGLGYTPQVDEGDAHGMAVALGTRAYTTGVKHRGFIELSVSQLVSEKLCFDNCRRLYGPGVQVGYQFATRGGFTIEASVGLGYAPGARQGGSKVGGMAGLGFGYTWRH